VPVNTEIEIRGHRALWIAVLLRAYWDLWEGRYKDRARRWFKADSEAVGSFRWICRVCDLNESSIKEAALKKGGVGKKQEGRREGEAARAEMRRQQRAEAKRVRRANGLGRAA